MHLPGLVIFLLAKITPLQFLAFETKLGQHKETGKQQKHIYTWAVAGYVALFLYFLCKFMWVTCGFFCRLIGGLM